MNCLVNYSDSSDEDERRSDPSTKSDESCDGDLTVTKHQQIHEINSQSKTTSSSSRKTKTKEDCHKDENPDPIHKRAKISCDNNIPQLNSSINCKKAQDASIKNQLNLPSVIQSMFSGNGVRQWTDDPAQHGNRARSFPHVEGNWATHVFIPVKKDERLVHFVNQLLELFEPLSFEILPEFHISLSRTVAIRHHWIDPLVDSLKGSLSSMQSCVGDLDDIKLYSNDERTRTFLCLEVAKEDTAFADYVSVVDKCFAGFKLPRYYQDPSFHISIAWCLGDVRHSLTPDRLSKAKELLGSFCAANPELSVVFAQNICCRSGNKSFLIPLII